MSETVWIKHSATEAVVEVPKDALPMYRQSGWDTVTKKELADREKTLADEAAAAEADMAEKARFSLSQAPLPAPPINDVTLSASLADPPDSDATGRQSKKGNA